MCGGSLRPGWTPAPGPHRRAGLSTKGGPFPQGAGPDRTASPTPLPKAENSAAFYGSSDGSPVPVGKCPSWEMKAPPGVSVGGPSCPGLTPLSRRPASKFSQPLFLSWSGTPRWHRHPTSPKPACGPWADAASPGAYSHQGSHSPLRRARPGQTRSGRPARGQPMPVAPVCWGHLQGQHGAEDGGGAGGEASSLGRATTSLSSCPADREADALELLAKGPESGGSRPSGNILRPPWAPERLLLPGCPPALPARPTGGSTVGPHLHPVGRGADQTLPSVPARFQARLAFSAPRCDRGQRERGLSFVRSEPPWRPSKFKRRRRLCRSGAA